MEHFGYVLATKMLVDNKRKIRFMYREEGAGDDSGWRFFCGDEDQAYTDVPDNIAMYDIQTILSIDKSVKPYLDAICGSAYERENDSDVFRPSKDFAFEPEVE